jgi:hypothetical protein
LFHKSQKGKKIKRRGAAAISTSVCELRDSEMMGCRVLPLIFYETQTRRHWRISHRLGGDADVHFLLPSEEKYGTNFPAKSDGESG